MKHPLSQFRYCPKCGSEHFDIHNEKSKQCKDCGFVYYFNPSSASVALILNKQNELLVCRRAKEPAKGTLDLPGGFIDMAETGEEGVAREVKEETGMTVTQAEYLFSLPNIYIYSGFPVHTLDMFFRCTVADNPASQGNGRCRRSVLPASERNTPGRFRTGIHSQRPANVPDRHILKKPNI